MSLTDRNLKQKATWWSKSGVDVGGDPSFAAPVVINVRWEDRNGVFTDSRGRERKTRSRVFTDRIVVEEDYLFFGTSTSTSPEALKGAYTVKDFKRTPSMRASDFLNRALL